MKEIKPTITATSMREEAMERINENEAQTLLSETLNRIKIYNDGGDMKCEMGYLSNAAKYIPAVCEELRRRGFTVIMARAEFNYNVIVPHISW